MLSEYSGDGKGIAHPLFKALDANIDSKDPRLYVDNGRLTPTYDLKEVKIGLSANHMIKIGTSLTQEEEHDRFDQLIGKVYLFARAPSDMIRIKTRVVCHLLVINLSAKPVAQMKQKGWEEKRFTIDKEIRKLFSTRFIMETKYPTW